MTLEYEKFYCASAASQSIIVGTVDGKNQQDSQYDYEISKVVDYLVNSTDAT